MTDFYDDLQTTANDLIKEFGRVGTIVFTDMLGAVVIGSITAVEVGIVDHALADSGIMIGDHKLLVAVNNIDLAPIPGARLKFGAEDPGRIVADPVKPLKPAGTALLYECRTREG